MGSEHRTRQAKLDEQIKAAESERCSDGREKAMPSMPSTFEELVTTWDDSGIDFQRRLIESLLSSIVVNPSTSRQRTFDHSRLLVALHA